MAIVTDDFERADGTLGANWTPYYTGGTELTIVSGAVRPQNNATSAGSFYNATSFSNNQKSTVVCTGSIQANTYISAAVRMTGTGAANNGYRAAWNNTDWYISRVDNGVGTDIAFGNGTFAATDTIECRAVGTTISLYQNGTLVGSATSATYTSGAPGFEIYDSSGSLMLKAASWTGADVGGPVVERVSTIASGSSGSVTAFFTGTPTVGNRIIVTAHGYETTDVSWTGQSDDATGGSNTYAEHVDRQDITAGGTGGVLIASAPIDRTKSGLGVTATTLTSAGQNVVAYEVSGLDATPVDVVASEGDTGLTASNISTGALAQANEFVVAVFNFNASSSANWNIALNWTGGTSTYINDGVSPPYAGEYGGSAYKVVSSATGETIEWTHDANSNRPCSIAVVTFKAVGTNGTGNLVGPGALLSGTAALFSLPVFTVQPTAQTGAAGSTATFTATATATPSPTYQWFVDNGKGLGFETISGATSSSYTTPTLFRAIHAGQIYKVVATNGAGAVTSNIVLLSVTDIPTSYYNCGMLVGNGFVGECQIGGSMTPALHTSAGPITGPGSLVVGSATKAATHTTTGALVGPGTLVTGSAARAAVVTTHTATGTLVGSGALVTGSAARTRVHATTGALIGQGSLVAGSAARTRVHATTGALIGQGSLVAGSAARTRVHATTGALIGQGSLVAGNATNVTRPIAYRNSAFATGINSIINDKPTGVVENDVMYALLFTQYDTFHATCTGWNEVAHGTTSSSAFGVTVLRKVAGNSEPTTYTFTVDGNSESMIWAYRGVDNSTPEDVAVTIAAGTGTTVNFPSITTVTDKAVHLALIANYNNLPTNPLGYVNLPDSTRWLTAATFTKATAGTISGITGGSGDEWVAVSIAMRPAVHATTGNLIGQGSEITGSATRVFGSTAHATSGALTGQSSLVTGTVARFRAHATSGVLVGPGSTIGGIVSENFSGSAGVLGSSWTQMLSSPTVNKDGSDFGGLSAVDTVNYGNAYYSGIVFPNDQFSQVTFIDTNSQFNTIQVLVRASGTGSSRNAYIARMSGSASGGSTALLLMQNGSVSAIQSFAVGWTNGDVIRLEVIGSTLTLYKNGVSQGGVSDTTLTSGSPGVGGFKEFSGALTFDNWSGGGIPDTGSAARFRAMATSGALVGPGSLVTGSAVYNAKHPTSGTLVGPGSLVTGSAARFRAMVTSGALVGQGSLVTGSAVYNAKHATSGALTGQGSLVTGSAARFRAMATSGALVGQGSLVTGSAARFRAMATFGTLIGQGSLVTGSAVYNAKHATSGALVGQGSLVIGAATRTGAAPNHATTGALIGQGSAITGIATRFRAMASIGTLVGQGSTITGTAARFRAMATSGALIGQGSLVIGTSVHNIPHPTTGALVGQGSTVTGTAARFRAMATSGVLVGQGSLVTGSATRTGAAPNHATTGVLVGQGSLVTGSAVYNAKHATSGALTGQGSLVTGTAARFRVMATSGALIGQGSTVTGTAARFRAHNTVGSLTGQISILTGNANRFRTFAVSGNLVGAGSLISGSSAHKVLHTTSGQLLGPDSLIAGSVNRFRVFSSSGNLIGFSAIVGIANHPPKISDYTGEIFIKDNIVSYYYQSTLLDSFSTSDKIEYHYITMNDPVVSTTINPQYYYRSENTPIFITNSV